MKKINTENINSIVVIQPEPFGNVLLTTSYFETLKKHTGNAEISYVVRDPFQKIVLDHPFIDNLIIEKHIVGKGYFRERWKTIKKIRKVKPDLIIDQPGINSTKIMTLLSGAKYKLGFKDTGFSFIYNLKAKKGPAVYNGSRKFDILGPLGIKKESYKLYYNIRVDSKEYINKWIKQNNLDEGRIITISPGSPDNKKRWKINNYVKLADLLNSEPKNKVVLVWGPKEYEEAKLIESKMESTPFIAPETDLNKLAALLERSSLLISNDGGVIHLSVTTNTKTIAIFGPTNPKIWSPASEFDHHHHITKKYKEGDNSFGITPEEVYEKAREVLGDE